MPGQVDRSFLFEGMCHALASAARIVEDAAILYASKRVPSSFHLAVMAREELGRCNLLWERYEELNDSDTIDAEQLKDSLEAHIVKLRHGQSFHPVRLPMETWTTLEQAAFRKDVAALNVVMQEIASRVQLLLKRQADLLHRRRQIAQYVNVDTQRQRWLTPAEITPEEAAVQIQMVMSEISLLLLAGQANALPRRPFERAQVSFPDGYSFVQRVLDLLNESRA